MGAKAESENSRMVKAPISEASAANPAGTRVVNAEA